MKPAKGAIQYATVPRLWEHHPATCVVLGSGPSLTREDVRYAQAHADGVIAVNDSYLFAPDATALYAADDKWWRWHHGCVAQHLQGRTTYPPFTGQFKYSLGRTVFPDVQILKKGPETGLSADRGAVALGRNGCYQAINVAVHFGATRILLLGVDMQGHPSSHFFGRHPDNSGPPMLVCLERFATLLKPLKALGIEVLNCTRKTALECFPRVPLEQALPAIERIAV